MINIKCAKLYCKDDITLIENYKQSIKDNSQTWVIHHRDEVKILPSGIKVIRTRQELIDNDIYYNCPANELIFLTIKEHNKIHHKGKYLTTETKQKLSKAHKGKQYSEETKIKISNSHKGKHLTEEHKQNLSKAKKGKTKSFFGIKFKEHFGITRHENINLYTKELIYYKRHNKCRWE